MNLRGTTQVFGILGDPVAHSLSPVMQNEALRQAGIDGVYVPFRVRREDLQAALAGLRALGIKGVNVTIPHKEAVCALLDEVDPEARLIGAVNTIVHRDGRLTGHNTDGVGLLRALAEDLGFHPGRRRILILGAGGAARAALVALCRAGAEWVGVANRNPARAETLVGEIRPNFPGTTFASHGMEGEELNSSLGQADLVVNATSIGLKGEEFPFFPWAALSREAVIYDMVYARGGTPLVRTAGAKGFRAADGLGMLVAQGEAAFALWTGQPPPSGVMRRRILADWERQEVPG